MSLATKLGEDSETPLQLATIVREIYRRAVDELGADADISTLIRLYEDAADTKLLKS